MAAVDPEIRALTDEGYRLFKRQRPSGHGCCINCCMYPDVEARLLQWPQHEIPLYDLNDWYFAAAASSPFPRPVIGWFLPRILELIAEGAELAAVGNEVVLMRLGDSGFPDEWPDDAVDHMRRFAKAIIGRCVPGHGDRAKLPYGLDEALCMFGMGGVDLGPALADLDARPTADLAAAFDKDWAHPGRDIWVNPFWDIGPTRDAVYGWLTSQQMCDRMLAHGVSSDEGTRQTRMAALHVAEAILRWHEWDARPQPE